MKAKSIWQRWLPPLITLALASSTSWAATDFFFNSFSNATAEAEIAGWFHGWGGVAENAAFDPAKNGPFGPGATSGSMKIAAAFNPANSDQQFAWLHALNNNSWGFWDNNATLPTAEYDQMEFDIYFDPACPVDDGGRIANLEHAIIDYQNTSAASWMTTTFYPTNAGKWIHVVHVIPGTFAARIAGCGLKVWSSYPGGLNGTLTFWVDNIKLHAKVGPIVLPTLDGPQKVAAPGLWLGCPGPNGGGSRQSVYTVNNQVPWYQVATAQNPVSYSLTVTNYPSGAGFQTHMFICSDPASGTSAIDWNGTNVIFLRIINNADGSAGANLWFKTNAPYAYSNMIYADNIHHLVTNLTSASVVGKWTLQFTSDTVGTLIAPDNSSTNFVIPSEAAALFPTAYAVFGIQGNDNNYAAQGVTLSKIEVKNSSYGDITDTFETLPLNNMLWGIAAGNANGVLVVPSGLWVSWTLPASGYDLLAAANINTPLSSWTAGLVTNAPVVPAFNFAERGRIVVPWASLPGTSQNYFRLSHAPEFTKLQVLMPGESNAPMTPTGKTGTALEQKVGVPFNITVNACDDYWQVVSSTDMVNVTSSDMGAILPAADSLVGGTKSFSVTLSTSGVATIMVVDFTDGTKSSNTGTTITVNP